MKFKELFFLILLSIFHYAGFSQESEIINNDSLLTYYLNQPKFQVDTDADVLILQKIKTLFINNGSVSGESSNWASETVEVCYKLNSLNAASGLGQITIPYMQNYTDSKFQLIVVSMENGVLVKRKIQKSDLLVEDIVNKQKVYKLNLSNVHPNTIIYMKYNAQSDINFIFLLADKHIYWDLENGYPTIESVLKLELPGNIPIEAINKNVTFDTASNDSDFSRSPNAYLHIFKKSIDKNSSYSKYVWKYSNTAAHKEESYTLHPEIYDKALVVNFLTQYKDTILDNSWKAINISGGFQSLGPQIIDKYSLKENLIPGLISSIKSCKDSFSIATTIYQFVRDSLASRDKKLNQYFLSKNDYNVLLQDKKTGRFVSNSMLTFLLRKNGFAAYNVLVSTTSILKENSCTLEDINYLLTVVSIHGNLYFLDAGFKYLPFGTILPKCYNGFAWIITNEGVPINLSASSIEDKNMISCQMQPSKTTDNFDIQLDQRFGKYSGAIFRSELNIDSTEIKDGIEDNKRNLLKDNLIFKDYKVDNKDKIDEPLQITYSLEYPQEKAGDFMYINPFFSKVASENPFKNVMRHYPVEYDIPPNKKYLFKMKLPDGYALDEDIEDKTILFQNGLFTYHQSVAFDNSSKTLSINYSFATTTNVIPSKDYSELRSFYEKIIAEQNKKIVLKKE